MYIQQAVTVSLVTVKAASKGRRKRKQTECEHESSAATDGQKPGKKSRRRVQGQGQGQAEKVNKKTKTRKSQFERRNIRWSKHHSGCHCIMLDCQSFDRVMLTNVPYLISHDNLLCADILPVLEIVCWRSDRASDLCFHYRTV